MKKATEQQIRHLERKHRALDSRIRLLTRQMHMTPDEHLLCRELKKQKLRAKDGLAALRQYSARS